MEPRSPAGRGGGHEVKPVTGREIVLLSGKDGLQEFASETSPPSATPRQPTETPARASTGVTPVRQSPPGSRPAGPSAAGESSLRPPISLAELLDNSVTVDWQEAVTISRRICEAIARAHGPGGQEYLLEPRHVAITEDGEVRVLAAGPGVDPTVKQVGRILRALLNGESAPVQLRLIASQAAFEVPGFASVQELADALRDFEDPEGAEALRLTFKRGLEAKFSAPGAPLGAGPEPRGAAWGVTALSDRAAAFMEPLVARSERHLPAVAAGVAALAICAGVIAVVPWRTLPGMLRLGADQTPPVQSIAGAPPQPLPVAPPVTSPTPPPPRDTPRRSTQPPARSPGVQPGSARSSAPLPETVAIPANPERTAGPIASTPAPLPEGPVERALALLRAGRFDEAQVVVDSIVLADPLFQPDSRQRTPALVAALQTSRRAVLPALAHRDLERARAALRARDYDQAISEGQRLLHIVSVLEGSDETRKLNAAVRQFLMTATEEQYAAAQRVYTIDDAEVTPPVPIGAQLPAQAPPGLAGAHIGTLELLINTEGEVETVRLHTPMNRYHERMIVPAAKAWRYRPALKDGRPVRFRLLSSITLPATE